VSAKLADASSFGTCSIQRSRVLQFCCLLLQIANFLSYREEGEAWVKELEDDVRAECEEKYGHVVHIAPDLNTQDDIYLKFDRVPRGGGGENAIKGLNGRFFGGRANQCSASC
jgi:RNA-binding protein 39